MNFKKNGNIRNGNFVAGNLNKTDQLSHTIFNSKSIIQLNRGICKSIIELTEADQVWLLDKTTINSITNVRRYKRIRGSDSFLNENTTNDYNYINTINRLFDVEGISEIIGDRVLVIDEAENIHKIKIQLLATINIKNNRDILLCLSYYNKESISFSDKEFVQYIYPQIKTAYEKLTLFEKLIENESKFRAITENLTDVVIIRDITGKYTYVSPSVKHYGINVSEVLGKSAIDFISPEEMPVIESGIKSIIEEPGKVVALTSIRLKLGTQRTYIVDLTMTNLLHVQGIKGIVINIQDNTDRVEVIKQVYESEEKYRSLLENANDGICLLTIDEIVFSNSKLSSMLGVKHGDLTGVSPLKYAPKYQPDGVLSADRITNVYKRAIEGAKLSLEYRLKRADNTIFDGLISVSCVKLFDGDYIMAIVRDISELKEAHRKVTESEARLSNILESMTDFVYLSSADYKIVFANRALKNALKNDIVGKTCYNEIYGRQKPCESCDRSDLKLNESRLLYTFSSKNQKHYQVSKTRILNSDGTEAILNINRDITEIIAAQNKMKHNEEKFRNIFNNSSDAIIITNFGGRILEVNDQFIERENGTKEQFINANFSERFMHNEKLESYFYELLKYGKASVELFYVTQNNTKLFLEIRGKIIDYQGEMALLHVSTDATVRHELERNVMESTIRAEENERRRFARDLHDGIGPYLSATKMFLNTISHVDDKVEREEILEKAKISIDEIIRSVKEISNNISPHILDNFGLIAALNSFKKKVLRSDVIININSNLDSERLSMNLEISVFRILIELINNTFKYAKASEINISVFRIEGKLEIIFEHNGKGFNFEKVINENKGNGLLNIKNRVNSLKGDCKFITSDESSFVFRSSFKLA